MSGSRGWAGACLTLLGVIGCGGATRAPGTPPPPRPDFVRTVVLRGPEGAQARIAEYGTDEAYFGFEGVRSPAAGFVFRGQVSDTGGGRTTYQTTWDGREYYPLHRDARGQDVRWLLYAPGLADPVELDYDEEASAALSGDDLYDAHVAQLADGTLDAVQTFDRAAAEASVDEELGQTAARLGEACGTTPSITVAWDSVPDELFTTERISVASYCGAAADALRNLCRYEPAQAFARTQAARITCTWGETWGLAADADTLAFTTARETNLQQKARAALLAMDAGDGLTLEQAVDYARTDVCRSPDGEHLVVVHPHAGDAMMGISYGTPERLVHTPQNQYLSRGWFFEPREFAPGHNASFRGADLRFYSRIDVDRDEGSCTLTCGERETSWTLLPTTETAATLRAAETAPAVFDRVPYALARDRRGTYYYVDRGATEATSQDFRVYRGPRGNLQRLEMRDVASDSEGQVFSTESGDLRLIVDGDAAQWIRRSRTQSLRRVPVEENYQLVYGELGVYLGQRFELPCDDY